jgi:pimeloyl-ACP methyl ester carboxylesterase
VGVIALPLPAGVTRETIPTAHGPVPVLCGQPRAGHHVGDAVMASGFFGTKEDFRELLALLAAAGVRGWAYDYRGQLDPGEPSPEQPGPEHTITALARDLRELAHAAGGGRPVHVIGHCLGGFVARSAVLAEPGLARSLTLLSCGPSMLQGKHQAMLSGLARIHAHGGTIMLWPLVRKLLADDDTVMREFWRGKLASMNPRWVTGVAESMAREPDRTGEVRAGGLPALVMHGKRDRRLWSAAEYADLAGRLRAGYQVIERASHSPNMEQPGATASALLAFWSSGGRAAACREPVAVTG